MNKKTELEYAINALFSCSTCVAAKTMVSGKFLDFEALRQWLKGAAETVYAYTTEGSPFSGCNYYGVELFGCKATRLYSHCVREREDVVKLRRSVELWILEDYSFALVVNTEIDYDDGSFKTSYRAIRTAEPDEIVQEIGDKALFAISMGLALSTTLYSLLNQQTYEE